MRVVDVCVCVRKVLAKTSGMGWGRRAYEVAVFFLRFYHYEG